MKRERRHLRTVVIAVLAMMLLANGAIAANPVSDAPGPSDSEEGMPKHLQLLQYVAELLTAGQEVPQALLNKILAWSRNGK